MLVSRLKRSTTLNAIRQPSVSFVRPREARVTRYAGAHTPAILADMQVGARPTTWRWPGRPPRGGSRPARTQPCERSSPRSASKDRAASDMRVASSTGRFVSGGGWERVWPDCARWESMRWNRSAVRQQEPGVFEEKHPVTQQGPALIGMGHNDSGGLAVRCVCTGTWGLMQAHHAPPSARVSLAHPCIALS